MLGSICKQLSQQFLSNALKPHEVDNILFKLRNLHESYRINPRTPEVQANDICDLICQYCWFTTTYIILDGLDESSVAVNVISQLDRIRRVAPRINVLIASRCAPEIEKALSVISCPYDTTFVMDLNAVEMDISTYVDFRLETEERFRGLRPMMKDEIRQKLIMKSDGM
jgi:hypothetical protein